MEATQPIIYCLYARKSSESDERQAMSIDSQIKEMTAMAEREGLKVVEVRQESYSAKLSGARPVFKQLLEDIRLGKFTGILTWAPDRLSRNAGDLGSLVDMMDDNRLKHIRTFSQTFSNTPNEKFLLMILCSQAKLENDNRGVNVKRGIRAKCEMGWRPCMPPIGYFNRAMAIAGLRDTVTDPERAPAVKMMFEMASQGKSGRHIQQWLESNNIKSRHGNKISLSQIYTMLKNPFYYGRFEYPRKSGKWYDGAHEPLISKELYDIVQVQLIAPQRSKWGAKVFPFKGFITCGSCGSSIVGEEKFKTRLDGAKIRHVYYHCSRQVNYGCTEPYLREKDLIRQLSMIIAEQGIDIENTEPGFVRAVTKFSLMLQSFEPRVKASPRHSVVKYANYVLENGSNFDKVRLVRNFNKNLMIKDRNVQLMPC